MEFHGRYSLPATPEAVWTALHDPDVLAACLPGCKGVTRLPDDTYEARAMIKIGPMKARFSGRVIWTETASAPGFVRTGTITGEGQGGAAGFAKGESEVKLAADGAGTVLTYDAKANVGGKLAQVGQRLIDATARSIADTFFAKFAELMGATTELPSTNVEKMHGAAHPGSREEGLEPQIWVVGLIGIVIILLIVFSLVL